MIMEKIYFFTPEMDTKLLKRRPKFLHECKMQKLFLEMKMNIKMNMDESDEYQYLLNTHSLMINFPRSREHDEKMSWSSVYNTFINLLNFM